MCAELFTIVDGLPGTLFTLARPQGGGWLDDEMTSLRAQGVDLLVSLLTPPESQWLDLEAEEFHCVVAGMRFASFPIPDMGVPADRDTAENVARLWAAELLDGHGVAIHCRGGIGRSSMMAAATLVALGWWPDRAFEQISERRGLQVPETEAQYAWVEAFHRRETS